MPDTEILDKLFLELSQFTGATTAMELALQAEKDQLRAENECLKKNIVNLNDAHRRDTKRWHKALKEQGFEIGAEGPDIRE